MLKTFLAAFALLAASCLPSLADPPVLWVPMGYQQVTSISGATALTVPAGAKFAVFQAEAQVVRFRDDGVAPTASVGFELPVGVPYNYVGTLSNVQVIETTSGGIVNVLYYR